MCHIHRVVGSVLQATSRRIKHPALSLASHYATLKLSVNSVLSSRGLLFTTTHSESLLYSLYFQGAWEPVELLASTRESLKLL